MRSLLSAFCFALILQIPNSLFAQNDSLVFTNGDNMVGEIKEMSRGVVTIETDYSDTDFKIDWEKISEIYSDQFYTVNLDDRTLLTNATITTISPGKFKIKGEIQERDVDVSQVVYFRQLDNTFWSRLSASVDLGFSITKANNLRQFNGSAFLGYKTDQWTFSGNYRQVRSSQDDIESIRRTDASLLADYLLRNGVFFGARLNFLSNTEQQIDLRTTGALGVGYYLIRTNALYWNGFLGAAVNVESFESVDSGLDVMGTADRESLEGVVGTEFNMYDVGDVDIFTNVYWYPSITESPRNRVDFRFDINYEFIEDVYVKLGYTINYDSRPALGASDTDYVILLGFGWEL